jgi:peptidoglycan hydrolase-like protein with peptidoglycan-binding domain
MSHLKKRAATALAVLALTAGAVVGAAPAQAAAYPCSVGQTLRSGQVNTCVKSLQTYLNGYINAGLVLDGSFGPKTKSAVIAFQQLAGIGADGVVGPQTRDAVYARTGIPVNSGASWAEIVAAGDAVFPMCRGWGYYFD